MVWLAGFPFSNILLKVEPAIDRSWVGSTLWKAKWESADGPSERWLEQNDQEPIKSGLRQQILSVEIYQKVVLECWWKVILTDGIKISSKKHDWNEEINYKMKIIL